MRIHCIDLFSVVFVLIKLSVGFGSGRLRYLWAFPPLPSLPNFVNFRPWTCNSLVAIQIMTLSAVLCDWKFLQDSQNIVIHLPSGSISVCFFLSFVFFTMSVLYDWLHNVFFLLQMDYINTSHPSFIGGSKAVEIAQQQIKSSKVSLAMPRQKVCVVQIFFSTVISVFDFWFC